MPTLREINKRKKMMGPQAPQRRSDFLEWNYDAEIYAFGVRLNEKFAPALLQQAFVDQSYIAQEEMKQQAVGIENPIIQLVENTSLIQKGDELITEFTIIYLNLLLPKYPREGIKAIYKHLISDENLSHISSHLGTSDLILSNEFPVGKRILANTLKAVIGALCQSSGEAQAFEFIRDFILTQLNQKDINEYWEIENHAELLRDICKDKKIDEPEPRLISSIGTNTLLAAYQVGFYSKKKMLGFGFGEDVTIATQEAAKDSLKNFFQTNTDMKPLNFKLPVESVMKSLNKPLVASIDKL